MQTQTFTRLADVCKRPSIHTSDVFVLVQRPDLSPLLIYSEGMYSLWTVDNLLHCPLLVPKRYRGKNIIGERNASNVQRYVWLLRTRTHAAETPMHSRQNIGSIESTMRYLFYPITILNRPQKSSRGRMLVIVIHIDPQRRKHNTTDHVPHTAFK